MVRDRHRDQFNGAGIDVRPFYALSISSTL
jgi:hypothetical protein